MNGNIIAECSTCNAYAQPEVTRRADLNFVFRKELTLFKQGRIVRVGCYKSVLKCKLFGMLQHFVNTAARFHRTRDRQFRIRFYKQAARRNGFRTAAALQKLLLIIRNRFKFGFDYTVPRRRFGECFLNERRKTHKPRFRILNLFNAERIIRRINGIRVHVRVFKEHFLTL